MRKKNCWIINCRTLVILILLTILAFETGCSSAYRGSKGRGMVPCPCEKHNKRR